MFFKIIDPDRIHADTLVAVRNIEAITSMSTSIGKVKIHLSCGKEFRAPTECLVKLLSVLKTWKITDEEYPGWGCLIVPNKIQAITGLPNATKIKIHMNSMKQYVCGIEFLDTLQGLEDMYA